MEREDARLKILEEQTRRESEMRQQKVAMQQQKAELAEAILSEDGAGAVKFSAEDVEALFEPIPATPPVAPTARPRARTRTGT